MGGNWKRTLYILFAVQFISSLGFSVVLPFLPLYVRELGSSTGIRPEYSAGLFFSLQSITMMIAAPWWGRLADRYGRKRMILRATYGGTVVMVAMTFAGSAEELVVLGGLQGLVTGTVTAIAALVAANAPRAKLGQAIGLMQVGQWAGIALGPLLGGAVADHAGFRASFLVTASVLLASGIIVQLGVHEAFSARPRPLLRVGMLADFKRAAGKTGVLAIYRLRFLDGLGRSMLMPFIPFFVALLVLDEGRVASGTGLALAITAATGIATSLVLGRVGDRVGHKYVVVGCAFAAASFYMLYGLVDHFWQLVALQALTGGSIGGLLPSLSALLSQATDPADAGTIYGADSAISAAARAAAPLAGAVVMAWFGVRGLFVVTGCVFCLVAILAISSIPAMVARSSEMLGSEPKLADPEEPCLAR
ncbi:MAG: MFS transporter [Truepera sp.]|jgi:DHA1 family multidrug resistance protein-like MFS transporter|nr:MFS transporter [Truepera sp.]